MSLPHFFRIGDNVIAGDDRRPPVGFKTVLRMRRVVVLPAPFGPSRPKIAPGRHSNETSVTAETQPR